MTKREDLPPDPEALEAWKNLPQNQPSKSAMPPMTGGMAWNRALLWGIIIFGVLAVLVIIANGGLAP